MAEALSATGQVANLSTFAKAWLLWDPANAGVYERIGLSSLALGDGQTALRAFTGVAEISSSNPAELLHSAWLCMKAKQYSMAAELALQAIKQREDNPNAYRALGIARYLQGDIAGARKAYASARWRPSTVGDCANPNQCQCKESSLWEIQRNDQRATPHALLHELKYMEFHKGPSNPSHGVRLLEGSCASHGCSDIQTGAECADAATKLNIPLNGRQVYPYDNCTNFKARKCVLDEYGHVKLWDWNFSFSPYGPYPRKDGSGPNKGETHGVDSRDRNTWKSPYLCKCGSDVVEKTNNNIVVVLSWLGDGNDVDLHMKGLGFDMGPIEGALADVSQGLGPELMRTTVQGKLGLGVYYNWAAAMGAARVIVWDFKNKVPTIVPFALPAGEYNIMGVAEVDVTSKSVTVEGDLLIR